MPTKLKKCDCKDEFQDKRYGKGKRLMNLMTKHPSEKACRCTVCEKEYMS